MKKNIKNFSKLSAITLAVALVFTLITPSVTLAATDPGLGTASSFSILAQTAITGTGTISGNVGLNSIGAGITALTDAMVGGVIYSSDGVTPSTATLSPNVQANVSNAFTSNIPGQASTGSIGPVLDGLTVTPGVYDIGAGRLNGGILTLNGSGIYIFRASSDLVSSGSVVLTNGARACDVYWRVETLTTLNGSSFVGSILAGTGIHFGSGTSLNGRALAVGGDVTLLNNNISGPTCASDPAPPILYPTPISTSTPVVTSTPIETIATTTTTVIVTQISTTTPTLPNTGINPEANNHPWDLIILGSVFALPSFFYLARKKQLI